MSRGNALSWGSWRWRVRDFGLQAIGEGEGSTLEIDPGTPIYCVDLWQGGKAMGEVTVVSRVGWKSLEPIL